jgi:hypothetical protein
MEEGKSLHIDRSETTVSDSAADCTSKGLDSQYLIDSLYGCGTYKSAVESKAGELRRLIGANCLDNSIELR